MSQPKVTICVPTIGRIEFLAGVKSSIAAQTFEDYEVLVLDNASPEDVHADLLAWASADPRVKVLRAAEQVPMWENFNRGVLGAAGEYVTFCHDDDELCPTFLERNLALMEAQPEVGFSGCNYVYIDESGTVTERRNALKSTESWPGRKFIQEIMRTGRSRLPMQTIFYRKSVFPKGGFDTQISRFFGDFVILMRMAEGARVGSIAEPLMRIRFHAGQASRKPISESIPMRTELLLAFCNELRTRWPESEVMPLEKSIRRLHALHLGWGWLAAADFAEASACAERMGPVGGVPVGKVLGVLERLAPWRGPRVKLAGLVRKLAERAN